ncbi:MAG: endo,4-beta-xylanase, partial [Patescibacteria group bacterium]|nr:endo,4-beta-xylanase [Patescibacteria group bacterium]
MRILGWLLLLGCLLNALPVRAEDYTGSAFILRDPFLSLSGGVASSSSFMIYSQTGARIESGPSTGSVFRSTSGTESYPTYTSPVITATASDTQVGLSWTASTAYFGGVITSYAVGQSLTSGGPYSYTNVGTSLSTTVTGLTNGSTYYFVIKAIDANQNQNTYSSEVSALPVASTAPTGGGGDGGGATPRPRDTGNQGVVAFTGRAFPDGRIVLLKDGEIAAEAQANSS